MFSKAFLSPKGSAQKNLSYLSPKGKDSSLRSSKTTTTKAKPGSPNDLSFSSKENHHHLDNNETLSSTQIGSTSNIACDLTSSMSYQGEGVATLFNEKYCRKVLEEMVVLRKELDQKNVLVDKLMKENGTLRHEMEEFVNAVDDARGYIDNELKECNQRIVVLEAEILEVRQENKLYKDELEKTRAIAREVPKPKEIEQEADGFYSTAQKNMEDFYFRLNEQLTDFMCSSQKQHEEFNKSLHKKIHKDATVEKVDHTKQDRSISQHMISPLRTVKQNVNTSSNNHNVSRNFFEAAKSPKGTNSTPNVKKNCSKQNLDYFLSHTTEVTSPSSYSLCNTSPGYVSVTQFDNNFENSASSALPDFNKSAKKASIVSPSKTSLLKTKLKSDLILQEMKKRLSGA